MVLCLQGESNARIRAYEVKVNAGNEREPDKGGRFIFLNRTRFDLTRSSQFSVSASATEVNSPSDFKLIGGFTP